MIQLTSASLVQKALNHRHTLIFANHAPIVCVKIYGYLFSNFIVESVFVHSQLSRKNPLATTQDVTDNIGIV